MNIYAVILAGGEGSRLWPLSTSSKPKQFLCLENSLSLLHNTIERLLPYFKPHHLFISTAQDYLPLVKEELSFFGPSFENSILIEPCKKNTAFATTWALRQLLLHHGATLSDVFFIFPVDHVFSDPVSLGLQLRQALAYHEKTITAFGVKPTFPSSSFGYLKKGVQLENSYYECAFFVEKPTADFAAQLIEENALWNTGIYLLSIHYFLQMLTIYEPLLAQLLMSDDSMNKDFYESLPSLSLDDALIRYVDRLHVMQLDRVEWMDIGSWSGLCHFFTKNAIQPT